MIFDLIAFFDRLPPSARVKARLNFLAVSMVCVSCITGHILNKPFFYAFGMELGMSSITAALILVVCLTLLHLLREPENAPTKARRQRR